MTRFNPYKTLGVDPNITPEEAKKVYRSKAKKAHPDTGGSVEEFNDIRRALAIITDKDRRDNYDNGGDDDDNAVKDDGPIRIIAELLDAVLGHEEFDTSDDLVKIMKKLINERIVKLTVAVSKLQSQVKRHERILKKFKKKNKDEKNRDVIGSMIKSKLFDLEKGICELSQQKEDHKSALGIVSEYIFEVDASESHKSAFNRGDFTQYDGGTTKWRGTY